MKIFKVINITLMVIFCFTLTSCVQSTPQPSFSVLEEAIKKIDSTSYTCKGDIVESAVLSDYIEETKFIYQVQEKKAHINFLTHNFDYNEVFLEEIDGDKFAYLKLNDIWKEAEDVNLNDYVTLISDLGFNYTSDLFYFSNGKWIGKTNALGKVLNKDLDESILFYNKYFVNNLELTVNNGYVTKFEYEYCLDKYYYGKLSSTTKINISFEFTDYNETIVEKDFEVENIYDVSRLLNAIDLLHQVGYKAEEYIKIDYDVYRPGNLDLLYEYVYENNLFHSNQSDKLLEEAYREKFDGLLSRYYDFENDLFYQKISDGAWEIVDFNTTDQCSRENAYCSFEIKDEYFRNYDTSWWYGECEVMNPLFKEQIISELNRYEIPANENNLTYNVEALTIKTTLDRIVYINFVYEATVDDNGNLYDIEITHQFNVKSYITEGELDIEWPNI